MYNMHDKGKKYPVFFKPDTIYITTLTERLGCFPDWEEFQACVKTLLPIKRLVIYKISVNFTFFRRKTNAKKCDVRCCLLRN